MPYSITHLYGIFKSSTIIPSLDDTSETYIFLQLTARSSLIANAFNFANISSQRPENQPISSNSDKTIAMANSRNSLYTFSPER